MLRINASETTEGIGVVVEGWHRDDAVPMATCFDGLGLTLEMSPRPEDGDGMQTLLTHFSAEMIMSQGFFDIKGGRKAAMQFVANLLRKKLPARLTAHLVVGNTRHGRFAS